MHAGRLRIAALLVATCLAAPVCAQVTTNGSALDSLGKPERPAGNAPRRRPPPHPAPAKPVAVAPTPAPAPAPKLPTVPVTPPAILALPPPVAVPLAHAPPAPTIPVADDAPGSAIAIKDGLRVTFGTDRADLNPATVQALRDFARGQVERTLTSINLYAYAAGSPDDPSTPRRLSLERALAARAVLMDCGIPSPRIYPRALGPLGGDTLPDRVDIVAGAPTPATQTPATPGRAG